MIVLYELTETVTACSRADQVQARKHSNRKRGSECKALPLAEELLTIDCCGESLFSLRMWPLIGQHCSSGRPHMQDI